MQQAYLISSNPFDSLDSVKEAYLITSDLSEPLDSVKEAAGFQPCRPVILEVLGAVYGEVPSSGWGMTVEQLRIVFQTLKTKTTRASEIYQTARRHIAEDWNVNFRSS
jgi:hypothetical protein